MITYDQLTDGTWYDGFIWHKGKQRETATLRWVDEDGSFYHADCTAYAPIRDDYSAAFSEEWYFEPNIRSEEPKT